MDFVINLCYSYKVLTACSSGGGGGGGGDDDDIDIDKLTAICNSKLDLIIRGCENEHVFFIDIAFARNREMSSRKKPKNI